jgi:hypothetical protein
MGMSWEDATVPTWLFLLPLLFTVLFVGYLGVESLADTYRLQTRGQVAVAEVSKTPRPKLGLRVMVAFTTQDGRFVSMRLERYRGAELGDTVRVEYDPADPANLQQAGMGYNYPHGLFRVGLAVGFVAFGLFVWRRNRTAE